MTPPDWDDPRVQNGIRRMLELRAQRIEEGERAIGWKLGFGAPASLERFGLSAPLLGFLTDAGVHHPGSTVSCAGWAAPVAEPEIAAYLDADVEPGNAAAAIGALGAAIELADIDPPSDDIEEMLAGNIYHRGVVLGTPDRTRAGGARGGLHAMVIQDGDEVGDTGDLEALTGDLIDILEHAAALLGAAGIRLSAGDVVITGSVVPPVRVRPGQEIVFELAPLEPISVRV